MLYITCSAKTPIFDVLPAIKTRYFYDGIKQLLYARLAYVSDEGVYFDLTKFEREPVIRKKTDISPDDSLAAISFDFSGNNTGAVISVLINADGRNEIFLNGNKLSKYISDVFSYRGTDELGWHWGVRFLLQESFFRGYYEKTSCFNGGSISGNIYAVLTKGDKAHFSAVAPILKPSVYSRENLAIFHISDY